MRCKFFRRFVLGFTLSVAMGPTTDVLAEEAAASAAVPATGPTTLWSLLGIPQGVNKLTDATRNARGLRPNSERKPPLKRIADPENMASENPAVKEAAKAKADADLAPQKIKAIRYLASVGCCCTTQKDDVKLGLLSALSDCTEEVRYEAALAFCEVASRVSGTCDRCNKCSCCDADTMTKLHAVAYGVDGNGCPTEASPRVREAAANALCACQRLHGATTDPTLPGTPTPRDPERKEVPSQPQPERRESVAPRQAASDESPEPAPVPSAELLKTALTVLNGNQDSLDGGSRAEGVPARPVVFTAANASPAPSAGEPASDIAALGSSLNQEAGQDPTEGLPAPLPEGLFSTLAMQSSLAPAAGFSEVSSDARELATRNNSRMPNMLPEGAAPQGEGMGMAAFQPPAPVQPIQPIQPIPLTQPAPPQPTNQPTGPYGGPDAGGGLDWGTPGFRGQNVIERAREMGLVGSGVDQNEARALVPESTGALLRDASSTQNVEVFRRSAISMDPTIRGYKFNQIYAESNGVYWTPVRPDLDSMLSKIDPGLIEDIVIIPGPYGLRYGPGFAFIDIERTPTPRYDCFESHYRTSSSIRANGGQLYLRETAYGGDKDWGYRVSYGDRQGTDYRSGTKPENYQASQANEIMGVKIPGSYHARDLLTEIGYNLTPDQRVEFSFTRLDQSNTDYPCQVFNLPYLGSYGFEGKITDTDPTAAWSKLEVSTWYNHTRYYGVMPDPVTEFPVTRRINQALDNMDGSGGRSNDSIKADSRGSLGSGGARAQATFGEKDERHLNAGVDFRNISQAIVEDYLIRYDNPAGVPQPPAPYRNNLPHSSMTDPGFYAEYVLPLNESLTTSVGVRVDFVHTAADFNDLLGDSAMRTADLSKNNTLWACYWNNKLKLDEDWTVSAGAGEAQRAPNAIERYGDGIVMGIIQSGFTRTFGNPDLKPERDWQVDLGLEGKFENFRGKISGYYAWINDYITFQGYSVVNPNFPSARSLQYINTRLATLAGGDLSGEYDFNENLTGFGSLSYVNGVDEEINKPLPSISPLSSTAGLRLHDSERGKKWGIEANARMVHQQMLLGEVIGVQGPIEEPTPGFTVCNLRSYYNYSKNLTFTGGIENLFDRRYQEHLDLRLFGPTGYSNPTVTRVLQPGFTPYMGVEWIY